MAYSGKKMITTGLNKLNSHVCLPEYADSRYCALQKEAKYSTNYTFHYTTCSKCQMREFVIVVKGVAIIRKCHNDNDMGTFKHSRMIHTFILECFLQLENTEGLLRPLARIETNKKVP